MCCSCTIKSSAYIMQHSLIQISISAIALHYNYLIPEEIKPKLQNVLFHQISQNIMHWLLQCLATLHSETRNVMGVAIALLVNINRSCCSLLLSEKT